MNCCKEHYMPKFMHMPIYDGCRPKCKRKCVGEFTEKFKVYEVCCREVVKICPVCGFEYEPHIHPMCPRCGGYGHRGYGDHGMGFGGMGYDY
ncbi:hypothetical protein Ga0466249_004976 [Sporomusaceae bacterium BoRhaA]|uniref:hypothetical protein n=1 Tax=Pelorhabdus rhamnosifermentans TaxID=2772457 RepID=UPI001C0603F9|nr:hypothetical protein [Pelorhabdus rhamnosifermentans]MBU2703826.1 hypothetical protein [Pelorhabdus rhamnosifermentans]